MNLVDLSDLEEGEILEFESVSPSNWKNDCEIISLDSPLQGYKSDKDVHLSNYMNHGDLNSKEKSCLVKIDLESISSDEGEWNQKTYEHKNGEKLRKRKSCGTVEDIMSEIGETITRSSHRGSRKSKEFEKQYSDTSYDDWRKKLFSSHVKLKKRKRKISQTDSDSEGGKKSRLERRRKRKKKKDIYYVGQTKPKVRDFDEVRRKLLENLKKQRAEEEQKETKEEPKEMESTEIQEVEMIVDCTNYVDKEEKRNEVLEIDKDKDKDKENEKVDEVEEEMDLIQLRLLALNSNKKLKEKTPKTEEKPSEDGDLDRIELLLRAEALKTALLKKREKRLIKLKGKKSTELESSGDDASPMKTNENLSSPKENSENFENFQHEEKVVEVQIDQNKEKTPAEPVDVVLEQPKVNHVPVLNAIPQKPNAKTKTKRKKRKSNSLANNLKENTDQSEQLEEDDRTLRSQLLIDLMKKKSLKDQEKKSVLMDAIQTSGKKQTTMMDPPPIVEIPKPPVGAKKILKKVNVPKPVKPVAAPVIPKPEIQRIIVHLGSEDSSDDGAGGGGGVAEEQPPPQEGEKKKVQPIDNQLQANYERRVELLLSEARQKIEGEKEKAMKGSLTTPEAVYKHLPPSQRLEYIRLKQKIAERERLKKQNTSAAPAQGSQSVGPSLGPQPVKPTTALQSSKVISRPQPTQPTSVPQLSKVTLRPQPSMSQPLRVRLKPQVSSKKENEGTNGAPPPSTLLLPSSQALISKLKLLLKKIKIEKTIEENYRKEIGKLKAQLILFEKKKTEQRNKIRKLGEESMKTYKAIQSITAQLKKDGLRGKEKEESPVNVVEKKKKKEKEEEEKEKEQEKEKTKENEGKEEKKNISSELDTDLTQVESEKEQKEKLKSERRTIEILPSMNSLDYHSPFVSSGSMCEKIDPNIMICQFDLTGICKDEDCGYQHLRKTS